MVPAKALPAVTSSKQTIKEGQWIHNSHYFNQYTSNTSKQYKHSHKSSSLRIVSCLISVGMSVKELYAVTSSKHKIKEGQWIHTSHYFNQYTSNKFKQYKHLPKYRSFNFVSCLISVGISVKSLLAVTSSKHTIKEGQWIHNSRYFNQYTSDESKQYKHLRRLIVVVSWAQ